MRKSIFFTLFILLYLNLFSQEKISFLNNPNIFPISVATQSTWNAKAYKEIGINLYITLWNPLDSTQLNDLHNANMKVICTQNDFALKNLNDSIIVGWDQMDEPDNAQWNDTKKDYDPCVDPSIIIERYNNFRNKDSSRPVYLNLGQGVSWLEWYGRGSKCFRDIDSYKISKNGYIKGCDIISFDIYPVNSGDTATKDKLWMVPKGIDSLYSWGENSKPAWCWIETTEITSNAKRKPTPAEVKAEVWMALIHGAKGIGYFCHSFYPTFVEYALLMDSEMKNAVKNINSEITNLASTLNSSTTKGFASVSSSNPNVPIDIMTKFNKSNYIFSVAMRNDSTTATFTVSDGDIVNVIGENRNIYIKDGKFSDKFKGFDVHLYNIEKSTSITENYTKNLELNLYPNPAENTLLITLEYYFEPLKLEIYNSIGTLIDIKIINSKISNIDITNFNSGIYFIKLENKLFKFSKL